MSIDTENLTEPASHSLNMLFAQFPDTILFTETFRMLHNRLRLITLGCALGDYIMFFRFLKQLRARWNSCNNLYLLLLHYMYIRVLVAL